MKWKEYRTFMAKMILIGTIGKISIQTPSKHIFMSSRVEVLKQKTVLQEFWFSGGIVLEH